MIAATPVGWKRKLPALLAGLALIHTYLWLAQWIAFRYQFHINPRLDVLHLTGAGERITVVLNELLNKNPGTIVFASLAIWVMSVFRKSDWAMKASSLK